MFVFTDTALLYELKTFMYEKHTPFSAADSDTDNERALNKHRGFNASKVSFPLTPLVLSE